jgi:hypothetical protein
MKKFRILIAMTLTMLIGCKAQLQQDPAPLPSDQTVQQARLEFQGCGLNGNDVGTTICVPGQPVGIVTDFPGKVTFLASGECNFREDIAATPPLTELNFQLPVSQICLVSAIYTPNYPAKPSTYATGPIYGGAVFMPNSQYVPSGIFLITQAQQIDIKFPNAVRGAWAGDFSGGVQSFTNELRFQPIQLGFDLIQVKLWAADGSVSYRVYGANYYSNLAEPLIISSQLSDSGIEVQFPAQVSFITVNNKSQGTSSVRVANNFSGYIRAYTVIGRTLVSYWQNGVMQWYK